MHQTGYSQKQVLLYLLTDNNSQACIINLQSKTAALD